MMKEKRRSLAAMPDAIQAVIWDLDGVIIDSADAHRRAWWKLAEELHIPYSDEQFWSTFGQRNDAIMPTLLGRPLAVEQIKELGDRKEAYFRDIIRGTITA